MTEIVKLTLNRHVERFFVMLSVSETNFLRLRLRATGMCIFNTEMG